MLFESLSACEPYRGYFYSSLANGGSGNEQGAVVRKFLTSDDKKKDSLFWNAAKPYFFSGFQVLRGGNVVVANWQRHGAGYGNSGFHLIEIDSAFTRPVAYWKQNASLVSSLHGLLVLNGIDTKLLHSDVNGVLQPLSDPAATVAPEIFGCAPLRSTRGPVAAFFDAQERSFTMRPMHRCIITREGGAAQMRKFVCAE